MVLQQERLHNAWCSLVGKVLHSHCKDREFDSPQLHNSAPVAQSVEQDFCKVKVVGSIPTRGSNQCGHNSTVECQLPMLDVVSSILTVRSGVLDCSWLSKVFISQL